MLNSEKDPEITCAGMAEKYGVSERQILRLGTGRMATMSEDARLVLINAVKRDETGHNHLKNLSGTGTRRPRKVKKQAPDPERMIRLALIVESKRKGMGCAA
jgi:hypothetical protein